MSSRCFAPKRNRASAAQGSSALSCSSAARPRLGWRNGSPTPECPIVGTPPEAIDLAEDRGAFGDLLHAAGLPAPKYGMATTFAQARRIAEDIGYPVLVRPSYVLGGRGMEIVYDDETLQGLHLPRHRALPRAPGARRPLPRGRGRDRRRRAVRRCRGLHRRRHGAHRGGRYPLRRLGVRAAAGHAGPQRHREGAPRHGGHRARASAWWVCSTCSMRSKTTCSTSWRPTRAPAALCRSSPRRPRSRLPRRAPESCWAPALPSFARKECWRPPGTAPTHPRTPRSRSRRPCCRSTGSAAPTDRPSIRCSARR